jgi:hypothetical protein
LAGRRDELTTGAVSQSAAAERRSESARSRRHSDPGRKSGRSLGAVAEFERDLIRDRTRLGLDLHANVTRNHRCRSMEELMAHVASFLRAYNRRAKLNPSLRIAAGVSGSRSVV